MKGNTSQMLRIGVKKKEKEASGLQNLTADNMITQIETFATVLIYYSRLLLRRYKKLQQTLNY